METATRPVLSDPTDKVVLFRRECEVSELPETAPARIWVDGRYILRVNGSVVARGPVRAEPRSAHYDVVDVAPYLVRGTNVFAITARHFGESTSWWVPVPQTYSLGAGSLVFEAFINDEWIVTDRSWKSQQARLGQQFRCQVMWPVCRWNHLMQRNIHGVGNSLALMFHRVRRLLKSLRGTREQMVENLHRVHLSECCGHQYELHSKVVVRMWRNM